MQHAREAKHAASNRAPPDGMPLGLAHGMYVSPLAWMSWSQIQAAVAREPELDPLAQQLMQASLPSTDMGQALPPALAYQAQQAQAALAWAAMTRPGSE